MKNMHVLLTHIIIMSIVYLFVTVTEHEIGGFYNEKKYSNHNIPDYNWNVNCIIN